MTAPNLTQKITSIGALIPEMMETSYADIAYQNEHLKSIIDDAQNKPTRLVTGQITAGTPNQLTNVKIRFQLADDTVETVTFANVDIVHGVLHSRKVYFANRTSGLLESRELDLFATVAQDENLFPILAIGTYQDTGAATATFENLICPISTIDNLNARLYRGELVCDVNPNYPAAEAGHEYIVQTAGRIGGASGKEVQTGDNVICKVDNSAAGDEATVGANWNVFQGSMAKATTVEAAVGTEDSKYLTPAMGRIMARSMLGVAFVKMMATDDEQDPLLWLQFNANGDQTIGRTGSGATFADDKYYDLYHAIQDKFNKPNDGCVGTFDWANSGKVYLPRQDGMGVVGAGASGQNLNGRLKDGWVLGTYVEDQSHNHHHGFGMYGTWSDRHWSSTTYPAWGTPGGQTLGGPAKSYSNNIIIEDPIASGANGDPRLGTQNNINSISLNFYILY